MSAREDVKNIELLLLQSTDKSFTISRAVLTRLIKFASPGANARYRVHQDYEILHARIAKKEQELLEMKADRDLWKNKYWRNVQEQIRERENG